VYQSKIFANGRTTLPKSVREALGVEAGDTVHYVLSDDGVQILKSRSVVELAGVLARDAQAPISFEDMNEAIAQGAVESGK
jgi:AbrB family looped-hinge helix DNA binding protein|tara:strand:+ start:831 stop:1073 length:243 start_codon:yes stop_codon:yes gene_type:complete